MVNEQEIKESNYSLFGRNSILKGEFKLTGKCYIHSQIDGSIESLDQETIILEYPAQLIGKLKAHNVIIAGKLQGELYASGKVILRPTAKVEGTISCEDLIVMPGASLNAQIDIQKA